MFLIIALHIAILISNIWFSYFLLKINNANDLLYINCNEKYLYMTVENQVIGPILQRGKYKCWRDQSFNGFGC